MDEYFCDLNRDHILIEPRLLPCGITACFKCIKNLSSLQAVENNDDKETKIQCVCCGQIHFIDSLPKNIKIENLIYRNIAPITEMLMRSFHDLLVKCQDFSTSRHTSIEIYFENMKKSIKLRMKTLKNHLDNLAEQLFDTLDTLQVETTSKLDNMTNDLFKNSPIYEDAAKNLWIKLKQEKLDHNLIYSDIRLCDKYKTDLREYEKRFYNQLECYKFEANKWLPNVEIYGKINNKNLEFKKVESSNVKLVSDKIKIVNMCILNDEIFTIESKTTRKLNVYDKEFNFIRESTLLENTNVYRVSKNLTIASDNVEFLYICDASECTIYVVDANLDEIKRTISSFGSKDGYLNRPIDICYHDNSLFTLDSASCRIQQFALNGMFQRSLYMLKKDSNNLIENAKFFAITDNLVAVYDSDYGILVYDFKPNLRTIIDQRGLKSMCFYQNYLFTHCDNGLLSCYQIYFSDKDDINTPFYYQLVFSHLNDSLKFSSKAIIYFDNYAYLTFPKEEKVYSIKLDSNKTQ